jgi:hypothetical protein
MSRSKQLYLFNQVYPDIPFHVEFNSQFNLNCLAQYWQKWSFFGPHLFVTISRCWDCTLRDTEHVPFLCRLASPIRARNLTMLWFLQVRLSWWFSISFSLWHLWLLQFCDSRDSCASYVTLVTLKWTVFWNMTHCALRLTHVVYKYLYFGFPSTTLK